MLPLVLASVLAPAPPLVRAAEAPAEVLWPFFNLPPFFEVSDHALTGGTSHRLQLALAEGLGGVSFHLLEAPPNRMLELAKEKRPVILSGLLKTPERMQYLAYSALPCRIIFDLRVIVRAEDVETIGPRASIRALIGNPALKTGMAPQMYMGMMQSVLDSHRNDPNMEVVAGSDPIRHLLEMLVTKRIDWFLFDPMITAHRARALGFGDRVVSVPVSEIVPKVTMGYLACPNTPWGREMIHRVDGVLLDLTLSGRMKELLAPAIPDSLTNEFERYYDQLFLAPAMQLEKHWINRRPLLPAH